MIDKMTIEETINGLQDMIQSKKYIEHNFDGVVDEDVCERAIELLKAQEPRVLTLEEVEKWIETPEERKDPVFVEYGKKMKYGRSGWRTGFFGFSPQHDTHSYGTVLRCWTSRPSDEQRKAVKWE